jgi:hypothetical protein
LQALNFAQAAVLLLPPLVRYALEELRIDEAIELVDVHRVNAFIEPFVFALVTPDRLLMLAAFVGVAGVQRVAHPFHHLVVEAKPPEQFSELCFERFLAHMLATAGCRVTLTLIGVAGAMIIDIALLLDLADHGAAAGMAGDQQCIPADEALWRVDRYGDFLALDR